MLNLFVGVGGKSTGGSFGTLTSSCTGSRGTKAKLGLRLVGVCCSGGVSMGVDGGVTMERELDGGALIGGTADAGEGGCVGSAGVTVVVVGRDESGVPDRDASCDGGRRGRRRMGTESR